MTNIEFVLGQLVQGQSDIRADIAESRQESADLGKRVSSLEGWRKYLAGGMAAILLLLTLAAFL